MRIAVVGGAGLVGRELTRAGQAAGLEMICLDRLSSSVPGPSVLVDLVRDDVESALGRAAADVVVHLAARVDPPNGQERAAMRALHVGGTKKLTHACLRLGIKRLVLCSSAVVYGAWPDNPVPIYENQPLRPPTDFPYGVDKAAQEKIVQEAADKLEVVIGRPAIIYGAEAKNYLTEFIRRAPGVLPAIDGERPPMDFVHVSDVASALLALATEPGLEGAYNIASAAHLTFEQVARQAGLRPLNVSRRLVSPMLNVGARLLPAHLRAPSYILDYLAFPFVTCAKRLREATSWRPAFTARDAMNDMLRR